MRPVEIAYFNIDEVDQALAARFARKHGAHVSSLHPKDPSPEGFYDAVLYNFDDLTKEDRRDLLDQILHSPSIRPMAVHGYDLSDNEVTSLGLHGVAVAQHLEHALFRVLRRAVLQGLACIPPDDAVGEETWIELVN